MSPFVPSKALARDDPSAAGAIEHESRAHDDAPTLSVLVLHLPDHGIGRAGRLRVPNPAIPLHVCSPALRELQEQLIEVAPYDLIPGDPVGEVFRSLVCLTPPDGVPACSIEPRLVDGIERAKYIEEFSAARRQRLGKRGAVWLGLRDEENGMSPPCEKTRDRRASRPSTDDRRVEAGVVC